MLPEEVYTCPNCGSDMKKKTNTWGLFYACPECGCTTEGKEQNFDYGEICPNCGRTMDESNECSYCGYDLGSDFD
jgi:ssDNA-binding Zn-finger/Zn-ribbon topoisomerase 1